MAFLLAVTYLTFIKGLPYFQKRYPKRIREHPAITSTHFKRRLIAAPDDEIALLTEVKATLEAFQAYVDTLTAANVGAISELDLERRARQYLSTAGFAPGLAATADMSVNDAVESHAWHSGYFSELSEHQQSQVPQPLTDQIQIQSIAWRLLTSKPEPKVVTATLSEIFEQFWVKTHKTIEDKRHKRLRTMWDEFLKLSGGDTVATSDTVNDALKIYSQKKLAQGMKPGSVSRNITSLIQPFTFFNGECHKAATIIIEKPKLPKQKSVDQKPPLYQVTQCELVELLPSQKDWKRLYVLLALHTGLHPSEAVQLSEHHFSFNGDIWTVAISDEDTQRKTEQRGRVVPLVYRRDEIRELVKSGTLGELGSRAPVNIGQQISKLLKQVEPAASAYSLRHTLRHNLDVAEVDPLIQEQLGGWTKQAMHLSKHMRRYGSKGRDAIERLKPRRDALQKALQHLPK